MFRLTLLLTLALFSVPVAAQRRAQPRVAYSDFSHTTHVTKQKLACGSCHKFPTRNWKEVRKGDAAFLDVAEFPDHASCLNCHRSQFFASERPVPSICANCHVKATPNDTARYPFPSLGEPFFATAKGASFVSEFRVAFPHDKHTDTGCAECHQAAKPEDKGFKTRLLNHATCFTCHNQESELAPLPPNCDACHKQALRLGASVSLWLSLAQTKRTTETPRHREYVRQLFAHAAFSPAPDYSQFKHDNAQHARLPCLLCHRRENNLPQPTLPGKAAHAPCTGCHAPQFANSQSPICAICHTDAQSGKLKPFPPLLSFDVRFDHAKHAANGAACNTCHRRNRSGVGFSIPARLNAHVTCFGCHTPNSQANGRNISSCSTCHQLGKVARTSEQAAAYRAGFSHEKHVGAEKMTCPECHQVRAGFARGRQVSAPLPLNHHAPIAASSCASCHNGKRAFGGDDFSVCKRCHKGEAWRF